MTRSRLVNKETGAVWEAITLDNVLTWKETPKAGAAVTGETTYDGPRPAQDALRAQAKARVKAGWAPGSSSAPPPPKPAASKPWPKGKAKPPAWLSKADAKQLRQIRKAIADAKLAHRAADIESLLRPAITFALKPAKPAKKVGVTRFGGDPDVPAGFAWPSHENTPLAFLAQFALADLAPLDVTRALPKRGVLAFFGQLVATAPDYCEHVRVLHFPDAKALSRTAPPHAAEADWRPRGEATATARLRATLPAPDEPAVSSLKLVGDEHDRYHDDVWLATGRARDDASEAGAHRLLGWPDSTVYYDKVVLLAQIDSDDAFGLEMGDVNTLRIFIAPARLAKADFRAVRATLGSETD